MDAIWAFENADEQTQLFFGIVLIGAILFVVVGNIYFYIIKKKWK